MLFRTCLLLLCTIAPALRAQEGLGTFSLDDYDDDGVARDDDNTCESVLDKRPANVNAQDDLQERPVWQQYLALQTEWMERLLYEVCFAIPTECIHVYTQELYQITRSQFSVSRPAYAELASPAQNYTVLVLARRKVQDMMLLLRRGCLSSEKIAPSLLLHVLPGRYEVDELNRLAEDNGQVETGDGEMLRLSLLYTGQVQFAYHNTTATTQGPAVESCMNGSLLYGVIGMLSEDVTPSLDTNSIDDAPFRFRPSTRPFARIAGMVMMFAFVLVLALAVVACCRGRRNVQGTRAAMGGAMLPLVPKGPEGPPPPPPPTVMYRMDTHRWSTLPLASESNPQAGDVEQVSLPGDRAVSQEMDDGEADTSGLRADDACVICFEREGDFVLVPCGHGGYCSKCAHTLLAHAQATRLCPICRAGLSAVVKIRLETPVGGCTDVLQASSARSAPRPQPQPLAALPPPGAAHQPDAASSLPGSAAPPLPPPPPPRSASTDTIPIATAPVGIVSPPRAAQHAPHNVPGNLMQTPAGPGQAVTHVQLGESRGTALGGSAVAGPSQEEERTFEPAAETAPPVVVSLRHTRDAASPFSVQVVLHSQDIGTEQQEAASAATDGAASSSSQQEIASQDTRVSS